MHKDMRNAVRCMVCVLSSDVALGSWHRQSQNVANLLMAWRGSCKDAVFGYFRLVGMSSLRYLFLRILSCRK